MQEVADVGEGVDAAEVVGGPRAEGRQRVLAVDPAVGEVVDAGPPDRHGPEGGGLDEHEPDPGVGREAGDEARIALVDLLQGRPPRHRREVDVGQVPAGPHDDVGGLLRHRGRLGVAAHLDGTVPRPAAEGLRGHPAGDPGTRPGSRREGRSPGPSPRLRRPASPRSRRRPSAPG